jgi:uncharacterized protein
MLKLRADPWDPGYGMGFDAASDDEVVATFTQIESSDWAAPRATSTDDETVYFVDGVRRVDLRVIADGPERAAGLFGTFAVGAVCCAPGTATFEPELVGRSVVVGCGLSPNAVEVPIGAQTLRFDPTSESGSQPDAPLWRLQTMMREAEGRVAQTLSGHALVIADGPLTLVDPAGAEVVGMTKRLVKHYLSGAEADLLPRLHPGERTPLFGIGNDEAAVQRYAWYTRLRDPLVHHHDLSGVVRCEVGAGLGVARAVSVADRVTALLPRFAGRVTDPRSPQNLLPVAALEDRLRSRMGHAMKVRRALTDHLIREIA